MGTLIFIICLILGLYYWLEDEDKQYKIKASKKPIGTSYADDYINSIMASNHKTEKEMKPLSVLVNEGLWNKSPYGSQKLRECIMYAERNGYKAIDNVGYYGNQIILKYLESVGLEIYTRATYEGEISRISWK